MKLMDGSSRKAKIEKFLIKSKDDSSAYEYDLTQQTIQSDGTITSETKRTYHSLEKAKDTHKINYRGINIKWDRIL